MLQGGTWGTWRTNRQILLVGKHQQKSVPQFILIQHTLQLLTCLHNSVAIVAVYNEDDTLGVLEVMPPQRTDLVLSTNIPYGKLNILVLNSLDVEACMEIARISTAANAMSCMARENKPIVGMVVTISPSLSLYRIVVFPAASSPTIKIRISFFPHSLSNNFENVRPMVMAM